MAQAARDAEHLILTFDFSRPLTKEVVLSVNLSGYRKDRQFGQMPKLRLKISQLSHWVYDQKKLLDPGEVQVDRKPKQITVRVPLELLGRPQRMLMSAKTSFANMALDLIGWRVLELNGQAAVIDVSDSSE